MNIMKDGKKITVGNPYLKNLRNNLRLLIKKAFNENHRRLNNQIIQFIKNMAEESDDQIKARMEYEERILSEKQKDLYETYQESIIKCGLCNTLEEDRIYYKRFGQWY